MLQIDENIGGRQDRKNNGLRTKTLAVGLLMMAGCFVVGYFGATTTTTTTAHTRNVSSPNGNFSTQKNHSQNSIQISIHNLTLHKFLHLLFLKHNMSLTRSGKVNGMVSNLQHYPYVTITNKTPYATMAPYVTTAPPIYTKYGVWIEYESTFCSNDYVGDAIASGGSWTASSRGACLVRTIHATLTIPVGYRKNLSCTHYWSVWGTSYSQFSIIMDGDDACCVLSSHETPQECPDTTSGSGSRISPLASLASDPRTGNGM